jgi:hypothetical protein
MQYSKFHPAKNDFCFAFVMAAMFVVTIVGAVAGAVQMARGHAAADSAATQTTSVALRGANEHAPRAARAGPAR